MKSNKNKTCESCIYWKGEKRSIGTECLHPTRPFRTSTAKYKLKNVPACRYYKEEKEK